MALWHGRGINGAYHGWPHNRCIYKVIKDSKGNHGVHVNGGVCVCVCVTVSFKILPGLSTKSHF